jgi:hypothetical protein
MPHSPNPPIKIVAPSDNLWMAASAEAMRLSMRARIPAAVYRKSKGNIGADELNA